MVCYEGRYDDIDDLDKSDFYKLMETYRNPQPAQHEHDLDYYFEQKMDEIRQEAGIN